jgi:hypothetical protein
MSPMPDHRHHVARLCQSLRLVRRLAPTGEIDELIAKARAGDDVGDQVTDLLRRLGLPDPTPQVRATLAAGLPGVGPGHFSPDGYICPVKLCTAWVRRRPGAARPFCEVEQLEMRRYEDQPR